VLQFQSYISATHELLRRLFAAAGKCKEFLATSVCKDIEAGEGAVADCISESIAAAEAGEEGDETGVHCCSAA
jgi:hypothetical protein